MTRPIIAMRGVVYRYGSRTALATGDLTLPPGSTALLGPNGSGKSTLLRLIATVTSPHDGTVHIDGRDMGNADSRVAIRRQLGYQTQAGALPGRMRVDAFCDYVAALKEVPSARLRRRWTTWVLHRVGLGDCSTAKISSLSGGMQRRLALAQALIGLPDLLVLDEPMASLDADHRSSVVALLADHAESATVVVATHHADELAALCHNVMVLNEGRMVFTGTPAELARQADGRAWASSEPTPGASCRATGTGGYRCVGPHPPSGVGLLEPTVHDGYLAILSRAVESHAA